MVTTIYEFDCPSGIFRSSFGTHTLSSVKQTIHAGQPTLFDVRYTFERMTSTSNTK